ncbi:hypothetical protein IWW37_000126 [Coemansia sp. RSA 2050]|nr:hypothetical protein IWW37_000126 [Coemansia sp. RSA 2050]
MLTDARTGRFITQRQVPRLALTKVTIDPSSNTLGLSAPTTSTLHLALNPRDADLSSQYKVRVWYDDVYGSSSSEAAQKWLTAFVGKPTRLLYRDSRETRLVPRYLPGDPTCHLLPQSGFADVFPFHTITEPSLSHVN